MAVVLFSESLLTPLAQAQVWDDRQPSFPQDTLLASLPQIPASISLPFSSKALSDLGINPSLGSGQKGSLISRQLSEWIPLAIAPHATIQDISLSKNPQAPTVLLLQDAHLHFEAQTHIAGAIDALGRASQKRSQKLLVGLEGADISRINFSVYNQYPHRRSLRLASEALLKANVLNGVEFAAIGYLGEGTDGPQSLPFEVTGVEKQSEYDANVKALRDSAASKNKMALGLEAYRRGLQVLKNKHLSGDLLAFANKLADYEEGRLSLPEYVLHLDSLKSATAPHLRELIEAALMEGSIDFKKVEKERNQILERLVAKMSEVETKTLLQYSSLYRAGELTYTAYYDHLKDLAQRHGVALTQFPEMNLYIQYVLKSESIDANLLFAELKDLEAEVGNFLAKSTEQKEVLALEKDFYLLSKLNQHVLTEDEWHDYEGRRAEIRDLTKRLYQLDMEVPEELKGLEMYLSILEAFYNSAVARNHTMVDKLLAENSRFSVLVAGGFHTQGLLKELKKHDVTVLTLTPKITKVEENSLSTIDVLARGQMPLDRLFAGERLFIPLAPQTVVAPAAAEPTILSFAGVVETGRDTRDDGVTVTEDSSGNVELQNGSKRRFRFSKEWSGLKNIAPALAAITFGFAGFMTASFVMDGFTPDLLVAGGALVSIIGLFIAMSLLSPHREGLRVVSRDGIGRRTVLGSAVLFIVSLFKSRLQAQDKKLSLKDGILLQDNYAGEDWMGHYMVLSPENSIEFFDHEYLELSIAPEDFANFKGFHVDLKGAGEADVFSLLVKKTGKDWKAKGESKAVIKEGKETRGDKEVDVVVIQIPVSEIKASIKKADKAEVLTQIHVQSGIQQTIQQKREPLNTKNIDIEAKARVHNEKPEDKNQDQSRKQSSYRSELRKFIGALILVPTVLTISALAGDISDFSPEGSPDPVQDARFVLPVVATIIILYFRRRLMSSLQRFTTKYGKKASLSVLATLTAAAIALGIHLKPNDSVSSNLLRAALEGRFINEDDHSPDDNEWRRIHVISFHAYLRAAQDPGYAEELFARAEERLGFIRDPEIKLSALVDIAANQANSGEQFFQSAQENFEAAYRSANPDTIGIVIRAHAGTPFIDEVQASIKNYLVDSYTRARARAFLGTEYAFSGRGDQYSSNTARTEAIFQSALQDAQQIKDDQKRDQTLQFLTEAVLRANLAAFNPLANQIADQIQDEKLRSQLQATISEKVDANNRDHALFYRRVYIPVLVFVSTVLFTSLLPAADGNLAVAAAVNWRRVSGWVLMGLVFLVVFALFIRWMVFSFPEKAQPPAIDDSAEIARAEASAKDFLQNMRGKRFTVVGAWDFSRRNTILQLFKTRSPSELAVLTGGSWAAKGMLVEYPPYKKALDVSEENFKQLIGVFEEALGEKAAEVQDMLDEAKTSGVFVPRPILEKLGITEKQVYKKDPAIKALNEAIAALAPDQEDPIYAFEREKQDKPTGFDEIVIDVQGQPAEIFTHVYFLDLIVKDANSLVRVVSVSRNSPVTLRGIKVLGFGPDTFAVWASVMAQSEGIVSFGEIAPLRFTKEELDALPLDVKDRLTGLTDSGLIKKSETTSHIEYSLVIPQNNLLSAEYGSQRRGFEKAVQDEYNRQSPPVSMPMGKLAMLLSAGLYYLVATGAALPAGSNGEEIVAAIFAFALVAIPIALYIFTKPRYPKSKDNNLPKLIAFFVIVLTGGELSADERLAEVAASTGGGIGLVSFVTVLVIGTILIRIFGIPFIRSASPADQPEPEDAPSTPEMDITEVYVPSSKEALEASAALGPVRPVLNRLFQPVEKLPYEMIASPNAEGKLQTIRFGEGELDKTSLAVLARTPRLLSLFKLVVDLLLQGFDFSPIKKIWENQDAQIGDPTTLPAFDETDDLSLFIKTYIDRKHSKHRSTVISYFGLKEELRASLVRHREFWLEQMRNDPKNSALYSISAQQSQEAIDDLDISVMKLLVPKVLPRPIKDRPGVFDASPTARDLQMQAEAARYDIQRIVFFSDSRSFEGSLANMIIASIVYISAIRKVGDKIIQDTFATIFA